MGQKGVNQVWRDLKQTGQVRLACKNQLSEVCTPEEVAFA